MTLQEVFRLIMVLGLFGGILSGVAAMPAIAAALAIVAGMVAAAFHLWRVAILALSAVETITIFGMVFGIVIAASMLALVFRCLGSKRTCGMPRNDRADSGRACLTKRRKCEQKGPAAARAGPFAPGAAPTSAAGDDREGRRAR